MKQIVDKLNKIAKKINENVELSDRDLIIDSLDSITKAYGGTPNDSNLIVDKLEDIYNNIGSGGGGGGSSPFCTITVVNDGVDPRGVDDYISPTDMTAHRGFTLQPSESVQIAGFYKYVAENTYTVVIPMLMDTLFNYLINADNTLYSDPVNITITDMGDGAYAPIVTDPAAPSSMTISASVIPK